MFTRDMIQGFIDGYVYSGGDPSVLGKSLEEWVNNHPTYKADESEKSQIKKDVLSYRISKREDISPSTKEEVVP